MSTLELSPSNSTIMISVRYKPCKVSHSFLISMITLSDDYFVIRITEDPVFGTPVFTTMVSLAYSDLDSKRLSYDKLLFNVRVVNRSVPGKLPLLGGRAGSTL